MGGVFGGGLQKKNWGSPFFHARREKGEKRDDHTTGALAPLHGESVLVSTKRGKRGNEDDHDTGLGSLSRQKKKERNLPAVRKNGVPPRTLTGPFERGKVML